MTMPYFPSAPITIEYVFLVRHYGSTRWWEVKQGPFHELVGMSPKYLRENYSVAQWSIQHLGSPMPKVEWKT